MDRMDNHIFYVNGSRNVKIPAAVTMPEAADQTMVPAVFLLHGFLGNRDEWGFFHGATRAEQGFDSISRSLEEQGIATVRLDFAGQGESEDDFRNYTLDNCVSDVKDIFQYCMHEFPFDEERVGLLGLSMGAKIGMKSLQYLSGIRTIVLLNPAGDNGSNSIIDAVETGLDYQGLMPVAMEEGEVFNAAASEFFGKEYYMSKAFFEQVESSKTGDEIRAYVKSGNRGLMIFGGSDTVINPQTYQWIIENTDLQCVSIPGANHDLGFEAKKQQHVGTTIDLLTAYFKCYLA